MHNNGGRQRGRSRWTGVMLILVASTIVLLQITGAWRPVGIVLEAMVRPVAMVTSDMTRGIGRFFETLGSLGRLSQDNQQLQQQVSDKTVELARLKEVEHENDLLRSQVGFQANQSLPLLGAHVMAYAGDNARRTLVIDRGSRDGVAPGQAVVSSGSLVGKIERVTDGTAVVFLVSDPEFRVQAISQTDRARGIIRGQLGTGLRLEQVAQSDQLTVKDTILTAGSDRVPKGILIGQVETIDRSDNELFQAANVRSSLNMSRLELVFVIKQ